MRELCQETDSVRMGLLESILESRGIATCVEHSRENDALGIQQLGAARLQPTLCVVNDGDYESALAILREHLAEEEVKSREEISCPTCGETNPGNFEICWKCGAQIGSSGAGS